MRHFSSSSAELSEELTTENFWDKLHHMLLSQYQKAKENPNLFGALKSANQLSQSAREHDVLADLFEDIMALLRDIIQTGQELDLIRKDLPQELLCNLFIAHDDTFDQWFMDHHAAMSEDDLVRFTEQYMETLRRTLGRKNHPWFKRLSTTLWLDITPSGA